MLKNLLKLLLVVIFLGLVVKPSWAAETVTAHLFYGEGCPHCAKEKAYLDTLTARTPELTVKEYEVYHNSINNALMRKVGSELKASSGGVPFLVIGDDNFIGFAEGITPREIEKKVTECLASKCPDLVGGLMVEDKRETVKPVDTPQAKEEMPITVPIFGQLDASKLSLPLLTFVLAFLDGFNPCAMWTLLFLISLLLGMKDRKRMWILGVAFIVASSLVYFLFLSAWLNLFLFLGMVAWIRAFIGVLAAGVGIYYLRDYCVNRKGGCKVMGDEKRQKIFEQMRVITEKPQLLLALTGIVLLAVAVNLVELVCSAGLPAIYTKILSLASLERWQYYLYLIFYIFIFMLDDLVVFFTAMITLKAVGVESKYARYSHLIGGILMLVIGLLLLLKPEWLMFG